MKTKLVLVCIIATISLCISACSSEAPSEVPIDVSCDDFTTANHINKRAEVTVAESFTVTLCSNPTTGFQWSESANISNQTVLEQTDHEFMPPETEGDKPPPPGTPSNEIWTFRTLKKGTSTIYLEYSRLWGSGEKGAWTFTLTITVK